MPDDGLPFDFDGFQSPRYTAVPDEVFDRLLAHLSGAELKVLLYIIRRTFGFKKERDAISLNQLAEGITTRDGRVLDEGTGLSRSTVKAALKGLLAKRCIVAGQQMSDDGDYAANVYALRFAPGGAEIGLPGAENRHGGGPEAGRRVGRKSALQQTVNMPAHKGRPGFHDFPRPTLHYIDGSEDPDAAE